MHLLVLCEQGLGDTIQFIRYVPLLVQNGAKVTVECQSKLRPLLQCLQNENVKVIARGEPLPTFDMHARLLTLPHILGSTPDNLPNEVPSLSVVEKRLAELASIFDKEPSNPNVSLSPGLPVSRSPCLLVSLSPCLRVTPPIRPPRRWSIPPR